MSESAFYEEDYEKRFDLSLWKKVFKFAVPYWRHVIVLALMMIIVAGIDTIFPLMTLHAIDHYIAKQTIEGLPQFALLFLGIVVVQSITILIFIAVAGKIDMWVCYDIRRAGFTRLQELSFSYFDRKPVGWLMARMTSDAGRLADTIAWGLVDLVWGLTMMLGISIVMMVLNWKLGLLVLIVVPILVFVSIKFQKVILKSYRRVRKTNSRITGAFNEGITGAKTTKTLVREKENLGEFQHLTGDMFRSSVLAAVQSSLYLPVVLVLGAAGTALAVWSGGSGVIAGTITYGVLVAFISYTRQFFDPIQEMARIFAELQNAQASAERIMSMIETEPEIQDDPKILKTWLEYKSQNGDHKHNGNGSHPIWSKPIRGDVKFEKVSFQYKKGEKVLENFDLHVKAGETIALVGETGSGKTTIVNLACRFYEPTGGTIYIDGIDYKKLPLQWLHSNLGIVLQTPHLFSGTILENIRYGRLDATDAEVEAAARLVNAHPFIVSFEKGYQNEVGEGGSLLSTGQKQLLSFARAILADPRIFILDEATSSVDVETEVLIQRAIDQLLKGRTSFIIAHRLSTIRAADRILVLDKGKIIEEGNHHQLLLKKGHYYELYTNQFIHEHEDALIGH